MSDDEDDAFKKFLLLQLEVQEFAKTVKLIHDLWWIFFKYFED